MNIPIRRIQNWFPALKISDFRISSPIEGKYNCFAWAATQAQQLTQLTAQLTDRLTSLEKFQYEGVGKSGGMRDIWGWIIGAGVTVIAAAAFLIPHLK